MNPWSNKTWSASFGGLDNFESVPFLNGVDRLLVEVASSQKDAALRRAFTPGGSIESDAVLCAIIIERVLPTVPELRAPWGYYDSPSGDGKIRQSSVRLLRTSAACGRARARRRCVRTAPPTPAGSAQPQEGRPNKAPYAARVKPGGGGNGGRGGGGGGQPSGEHANRGGPAGPGPQNGEKPKGGQKPERPPGRPRRPQGRLGGQKGSSGGGPGGSPAPKE